MRLKNISRYVFKDLFEKWFDFLSFLVMIKEGFTNLGEKNDGKISNKKSKGYRLG